MRHAEVSPRMRINAKLLRRTMTVPERKLWGALRAHRLAGHAFRRQMPIDGMIVDFACPAQRLIVELDGNHHGEAYNREADAGRDAALHAKGWQVLRFWNDEIMTDFEGVLLKLRAALGEKP